MDLLLLRERSRRGIRNNGYDVSALEGSRAGRAGPRTVQPTIGWMDGRTDGCVGWMDGRMAALDGWKTWMNLSCFSVCSFSVFLSDALCI